MAEFTPANCQHLAETYVGGWDSRELFNRAADDIYHNLLDDEVWFHELWAQEHDDVYTPDGVDSESIV